MVKNGGRACIAQPLAMAGRTMPAADKAPAGHPGRHRRAHPGCAVFDREALGGIDGELARGAKIKVRRRLGVGHILGGMDMAAEQAGETGALKLDA